MKWMLTAGPEPADYFARFWAAVLLLLVAVTHRRWLPITDFPRVPLLPFISLSPEWANRLAIADCVAALGIVIPSMALVVIRKPIRSPWLVISLSLLAAFALDQHRLQPWAYQSAIYGLIFATLPWPHSRRWLVPLASTIYLYSAAGKFDYQFVHTVGQDFLATIMAPLGGLPEKIGPNTRAFMALSLPSAEALIGIGWLVPRTRRLAGAAAIGMHAGLIGVLGPWGLNHSPGVLVWNLALIGQAWFLAVAPVRAAGRPEVHAGHETQPGPVPTQPGPVPTQPGPVPVRRPRPLSFWLRSLLVPLVVTAAILLPLSERWGYWDHWLSWALYSPHTSRVDVQIHSTAIDRLPASARESLREDREGDGWRDLDLGDWSLRTVGVPVYPQARYQLALAVVLADRADIDREIRGVVKGVSDRRTGRRETAQLLGRTELRRGLRTYRFRPSLLDAAPGGFPELHRMR